MLAMRASAVLLLPWLAAIAVAVLAAVGFALGAHGVDLLHRAENEERGEE